MKQEQLQFTSSEGNRQIFCTLWLPDGDVRGVLQISHGMAEYVDRYAPLAEFLTARGYAVCGNDHFGHGRSVTCPDDLGYIPQGGADILVDDLHLLTSLLRQRFPSAPLTLLGHSMGSFVARLYSARYGADLDAVIFMGSAGPGQPTAAGKLLAKLTSALRGSHRRSPLIDGIAFGSYNSRLGRDAHKFAWLSRDEAVVAAYDADPLCGYIFCADGFHTLFDLLGRVSAKDWAAALPADLPILVVSGGEDPVGGWGKGVRALYDIICRAGCRKVSLKIYPEDRHEILNELDREAVMTDLAAWLETATNPKTV